MRILGIETSTGVCSVALTDGERMGDELSIAEGLVHSEKLIPLIDRVLKRNSLPLKRLDGIAVSVGPGSFTGVRIGVATARAFAQVLDIPLAGVLSLDALAGRSFAAEMRDGMLVCPVIDAMRREVYTALYSRDKDTLEKHAPCGIKDIDELMKTLKEKREDIFFLGEAVDLYGGLIKKTLGGKARIAPEKGRYASALSIASIGLKMLGGGYKKSFAEVLPVYVRQPAARERKGKKI